MRRIMRAVCLIALLAAVSPVRAQEDAKPREIIDKAIKAQGGADKLKKYKATVSKTKGKFYGMGEGIEYTGTTSLQLPDRIRNEVETDAGGMAFKFVQVISGDKGWIKFNDTTMDMNEEGLKEAKEQMNAGNITHLVVLTGKEYKLSELGDAKVGNRPVVGVRVERKGYRDVSLFFDKENFRLLKSETRGKDVIGGGGEFTSETLYEDYKKVDGMSIAHKVTINRDGKKFIEGTVTEVKLSEKLDDSVFAKP